MSIVKKNHSKAWIVSHEPIMLLETAIFCKLFEKAQQNFNKLEKVGEVKVS